MVARPSANTTPRKKKSRLQILREALTEPIQPRGQAGNRNAEKQDRELRGGANKGIAIPRRNRKR